jgi:hypothetical protein
MELETERLFIKLLTLSQLILAAMSHNVLVVCDGLPARIRALRSKDQGWQTVGEAGVGMGYPMT